MNRFPFALLVLALLTPSLPAQAADLRIGYVDMRRVLTESKAGKQVKSEIEKAVKERQETLGKEEQKLREMQQAYEKDKLVLSEPQKQEKQKEFEARLKTFQQHAGEANREIQQREQDYTKRAVPEIRAIIRDIAKQEKLSLVFEKNEMPVLYAAEGPDLTDKVIKRFDARPAPKSGG